MPSDIIRQRPQETKEQVLERAQTRAIRIVTKSRVASLWSGLQVESWTSDGSRTDYRGTVVMPCPTRHRHQLGCGHPIVGEARISVYWQPRTREEVYYGL